MGQQLSWHLDQMNTIKVMQKQFAQNFIEMGEKIEMHNKTINKYKQEWKASITDNIWPQVDNIIEQKFHILEASSTSSMSGSNTASLSRSSSRRTRSS